MNNGQKVISAALRYEGTVESPFGSNSGPRIDDWQWAWDMGRGTRLGPQPWCGMAVDAWFREAGVDDSGLGHPATRMTCQRADALGGLAAGRYAQPGTLLIKCGIHIGLVVHDRGDGLIDTIEGNANHGVRRLVRVKSDWRLIVPPALAMETAPIVPATRDSYGFDDLNLSPRLFGPWPSSHRRDLVMEGYAKNHPDAWVAPVKVDRPSPFAFRTGPKGTYGAGWRFGGWPEKDVRDEQMERYARRVSHRNLRTWRKRVPVPVQPSDVASEEVSTT